jgi:hypothetical protein
MFAPGGYRMNLSERLSDSAPSPLDKKCLALQSLVYSSVLLSRQPACIVNKKEVLFAAHGDRDFRICPADGTAYCMKGANAVKK